MTRTPVALALAFLFFGCGDSSGPGAGPANMVAAGGNAQRGPAFGSPPLPLRVLVTGSDGAPFPGASVTWQVTAGGGSVTPTTTTTDATGHAGATVTLAGPGSVSIRARVGGLNVTFQVTSVAPCLYFAPFVADTTITGALAATDCPDVSAAPFGTTYKDHYDLPLGGQKMVSITMRSTAVDAFLWLWGAGSAGPIIAVDDDGGVGPNSTDAHIKAVLRAGTYEVWANTYDSTTQFGSYTLTSATATTVTACEEVWLSGNVAFAEAVAATDCVFTIGQETHYSDEYLIILRAGQSVTFLQSSNAFDPYLSLFRVDQDSVRLVAENDNGGGGTSAQIVYNAGGVSAVYVLDAGTALPTAAGDYTLSIGPISGAPPAGALGFDPRPGQRLDLARARLRLPLRRD